MVARANPPTPGSSYRIKVGQTISGIVWSNAAFTVAGFWSIIYDDGEPDFWPITQTASGSSRAAVLTPTGQIAKKNGWVIGGQVSGGGTLQRGQAYHQAFVVDTNLTVVSDVIACGYQYAGHVVEFGTFVEPGPAGGHGFVNNFLTVDPAAGSENANQTVPTGAIWRLESASVQLVQGATQTPLPTLRIRSPAGNITAQIPVTVTAIAVSTTSQLTWGVGLVQLSFTTVAGDEFHTAPVPNEILFAGSDISTVTDGIGANTNYGAMAVQVEEWVMPN